MSAIEINKGECLRAQVAWADDAGPIDLTGRTLSIVEANPAALTAGTVTAVDAIAGTAEVHIDAATAATMRPGRVNWIRIGMLLADGCIDTTPPIWINVV